MFVTVACGAVASAAEVFPHRDVVYYGTAAQTLIRDSMRFAVSPCYVVPRRYYPFELSASSCTLYHWMESVFTLAKEDL